jgi:hypothetical protein
MPRPAARRAPMRDAPQTRDARLQQWHRWLAWYPVGLIDGGTVWLRIVERRWCRGYETITDGWWEYRRAA